VSILGRIPKIELRAAIASVVVGVGLLVLKFIAYFLTGSSAIFADAMESIVNVAASLVAAYSLWVAHTPADEEHPYGHGKIEFMSAGFEGGMILLASIIMAAKAIVSIVRHDLAIESIGAGLVLMSIAMLFNGGLGFYLIRTGKRQDSVTLEADGHHLLSDAITSLAAVLALVLVKNLHWTYADPIIALLMALYIMRMGLGLVWRSAAGLMDRQDTADERRLKDLLNAHIGPAGKDPRICSYHKLRHRHSGRYHWVDFHIVVPATLTVKQGHDIASAIEYEMELMLGEGNATAHIEPCEEGACANCGETVKSQSDSRAFGGSS
jgi:cation diffusion facilitator family transporter